MSRRLRAALAVLCVAILAILIWLDRIGPANTQPKPDESKEQTAARDFAKYHAKSFRVADVVDGDTIDIDVADGKFEHTRIRLLGIDAPESRNPNTDVAYFGPEASRFAEELAQGKDVTVYLDTQDNTRGYYGRLLAYVQLPDKTFLNETLVSEGYAYADLRFKHSNYNRYEQLDSVARAQGKGLWARVTRDDLPKWLQREKPTLLQVK